jgi:TonB family protein
MSPPLWFANLLYYCLQLALLIAAGTALPAIFRLRPARILLAYWQGLLLVCLVLPALQPWRPLALDRSPAAGMVSISFHGIAPGAPDLRSWLYPIIAGVLVAGIIVRLVRLGVGSAKLRAIRLAARAFFPLPLDVREVELRLRVFPRWYLSPGVESPATFGLRRPAILLPARFPGLASEFQRAIAGHELLHVARHDWLQNVFEELILAVFWFHPAVAWLVSRIRLSREQAVDAEVVRAISPRKPYLQALLEIAGGDLGAGLGAAPTFLRERQLTRRIEMLVKEGNMSKGRLCVSLMAMIGLLAIAGVAGVHRFPLRTPEHVRATGSLAGEEAGQQAAAPKAVYKVNPIYPPEAKKAGIEGIVILRATIEKDGTVSKLEVRSGKPMLAKAALEAVQKWRYAPMEKAVITDVTINFTLAKDRGHDSDKTGAVEGGMPGGIAGGVNGGVAGGIDGGVDGKVYAVGNGVSLPVARYKPEPPYTKEARAAKLAGTVVLQAVIGADGSVANVKVIKPLDAGLSANAVETVRTWKFKPAQKDGKPVACRVTIEVSFRLT